MEHHVKRKFVPLKPQDSPNDLESMATAVPCKVPDLSKNQDSASSQIGRMLQGYAKGYTDGISGSAGALQAAMELRRENAMLNCMEN